MKYAFWSPTPFSGRKTSNLLLMALRAAAEGKEQLVIHADPVGSGPEHFLLSGRSRSRMRECNDFGVETLENALKCREFDRELAIDCAYSFCEERLHVLPAGNKFFYMGRDEVIGDTVAGIMKRASGEFANVWVELPGGECGYRDRILEEADVVVICFSQSFCEFTKITEGYRDNKFFYMIGAYEKRCVFGKHNLTLLYPELRKRCGGVPYHGKFMEACCLGTAELFWERGRCQGEDSDYYSFFGETEKTYQELKRYYGEQYVEE